MKIWFKVMTLRIEWMTMFHQQADGVRLVLTGGPVQRCDAVVHVCHERSLNRTDQFLYSLSIISFFSNKTREFRKKVCKDEEEEEEKHTVVFR